VVPEDDAFDAQAVYESIRSMVSEVNQYVPGYRLKSDPIVDRRATPIGMRNVVVILLEVEGAGDYLPKYAGNLDVMTTAARQTGELFARHLLNGKAAQS
jgi:acetaldehyde dehydrogenase